MQSPEPRSAGASHRAAAAAALALVPVALWSLTHRYVGLVGDAELYAVQALAHLNTNLADDLFLQNSSQDRYTIFSPVYAWFIDLFGLRSTPLVLFILFKLWFFAAVWALIRKLANSRAALLTAAFLVIIAGDYGAFHVFHFSEDMLTARSLAEALAMTALACHFHGRRIIGLAIAVAAVSVHALIALPVVLLLLSLGVPLRFSIAGALAGVAATLAIALTARASPWAAHLFPIMDTDWLEVVRERSQFVFLQLWTAGDWKLNASPFISLTMSALALPDPRIRKLCASAMLVGATGLVVAFIAGLVGPVAILLQGQAWRWVWVTALVSVLMLAPTVLHVWRDDRCGPLCAILLIAGWTNSAVDSAACIAIAAALALWSARKRIPAHIAPYMQLTAVAVAVLLVVVEWNTADTRTILSSTPSLQLTRKILGLDGIAILLAWLVGYWIRASQSIVVLTAISLGLGAATAFAIPGAFKQAGPEGGAAKDFGFSDWRNMIPPNGNVFVLPAYNSAAFAWFILERPSYLTVDQSSGVIFSRPTALEVRRRSQVLLPVMDPDWRLLSRMRRTRAKEKSSALVRPLTKDRLLSICSDPNLIFVVAKEDVGFDSIGHTHNDDWKNWRLYDCRRVNLAAAAQ
jgi:hypothetical protein